jgi:oligosaccharyltransferase complex subunit delta (ribophorin II)
MRQNCGVEVTNIVQKYADIPTALTSSKKPLQASIVIGSFGSSKALKADAFSFTITASTASPTAAAPVAARYSALPEIHHIFRDDPRSPPKILSLVFTAAVLAALPGLFITWIGLGANLSHLGKAFGSAPISHTLFFSSILGIEFAFWQYYTHWRLYTVLPVAGVAGLVAIVSGSRALSEVQQRRLNGER